MKEFIISEGVLKKYTGNEKTVIIPAGVTECDSKAFYGDKEIEKIVFPEGLKKVKMDAFYDCSNLNKITFPDNVEFELYICGFCPQLKTLIFKGESYKVPTLLSVECPELNRIETTEKAMMALAEALPSKTQYYNLSGIKMDSPDQRRAAKAKAVFAEAKKKINTNQEDEAILLNAINKNEKVIRIPNGITAIPDSFFKGCESAETVILGDDVTLIESHAFSGCKSLQNVVLSPEITGISKTAFGSCGYIQKIIGNKKTIEIAELSMKGNFYVIPDPKKGLESELFDMIHDDIPDSILWCGCVIPKLKYSDGKQANGVLAAYIGYAYCCGVDISAPDTYGRIAAEKRSIADAIASKLDRESLVKALETWLPEIVVLNTANGKREIAKFNNPDAVKRRIKSFKNRLDLYDERGFVINSFYDTGIIAYFRYANAQNTQAVIQSFELWNDPELFQMESFRSEQQRQLFAVKKQGKSIIALGQTVLALNTSE